MRVGLPTRRAYVVAALLGVGALDLHATAIGVRAHTRLLAHTLAGVRLATVQARPRLMAVMAAGDADAPRRVVAAALDAGIATSAEAFLTDGKRLAAQPDAAHSAHWLSAAEMQRLRAGEILTATQLAGPSPRVLAYVLLTGTDAPVVLRLTTDASDVVADLRDRQEFFVTQAMGLVLVLATIALLAPARGEPSPASPPVALVAYEEAMERLRARDQEISRRHQRERSRMEGELRDKEPFVRAGELTVGVVHEIRNGLGTIVGYARLVQSAGGAAAEHARAIVEECQTLETVVRRFMEFVKDDALRPATFDLGRMLSRVAARESRGRAGPEMVLPRGEVGPIEADEDVLERAFENLVRNARDAAGPAGHVWIDVERGGGSAVVTIADDGPGMAPAVRDSLRPFFTTKSGGLGLGLPLAFKIVRQHGGELTLGDRQPRGLVVRVTLPLARSVPPPPVTDGNDPASPGGVTRDTSIGVKPAS
jgi:signal transduction histidine kinase